MTLYVNKTTVNKKRAATVAVSNREPALKKAVSVVAIEEVKSLPGGSPKRILGDHRDSQAI